MIRKRDNRRELTDVLIAHGGYQQHMGAAFQYNLKRRLFFRPCKAKLFIPGACQAGFDPGDLESDLRDAVDACTKC